MRAVPPKPPAPSTSLAITPTAKLDLNNNDLVVRATAATKDAVHDEIEADIVTAQNGLGSELHHQLGRPGHHQFVRAPPMS